MNRLENYKEEIGKRIGLLVVLCILALLAMLFGNFYLKSQMPLKENATDYVVGFFTGLEIICVFYIGKLAKVYKNPDELRKMYVKETDEREMLIRMKSGANIVPIFSMLIVIVAFVYAYISYEVFVVLQVVAFAQIIISKLLKIYWQKKI